MSSHHLFEVACKALLLDESRKKVLLVICQDDLLGVPGGHLETNETPLQAMRRELAEEIGLEKTPPLTELDFTFCRRLAVRSKCSHPRTK